MKVEYIVTTSDKLSQLSVVNGQLIYLSDKNASYYDMANTRNLMSSMRMVSTLPSAANAQEGVLYGVVNGSGHIDAYVWDASSTSYIQLSGYVATTSSLGLVRPDGTTITIDANGVISCHAEVTSLPASAITYNNTTSELSATNAQGAIDEVKGIADDAVSDAAAASQSASSAASSASSAASAASSAQQTATQAASDAAAAQTAAEAAASQVSALESRIQALETFQTSATSRLTSLETTASISLTTEG